MTEKEDAEIRPPKETLSPFNMPDLTINIGEEKLYVNRDHLMEVSQKKQLILFYHLAYEFQAETPLFKIDGVLATCMKGKKHIHLKTLIDELLLAELYSLIKYLTVCIEKASTCSHKKFEIHPKLNEISGDTKSKTFLMRCAELESKIEDCMQVIEERYCYCDECCCRRKLDKANDILNFIKEKDNFISSYNEF
ncbi:Hypothetical predicted protein [Mytilus galloprovincialis]|uniref:BTB domain-containing protein n=1 Tax=Mytilus galloprovincialis TaxID=29158 RepID=A0A8B6FBF6_MYTGA|nr:Hypothetical predicted protein [Mytilus galloprovincialis]